MLESEGLQTRSLQKIQMPGDNKPTPVFIDSAPAQRKPTAPDNKQNPVAKELVRSIAAKYVNSFLRSVCISSHHEIL
jgi:hypothetical protein